MNKDDINFIEKWIDMYYNTEHISLKVVIIGLILMILNKWVLEINLIYFLSASLILLGLFSNLIFSYIVKYKYEKLQIIELYNKTEFKSIIPQSELKAKRIYIYQKLEDLNINDIKGLCKDIKKKLHLINKYKKYLKELEFYGISYIPMLFYSGNIMKYLDCKIYEHYQTKGNNNKWVLINKSEGPELKNDIEIIDYNIADNETEIILLIGITTDIKNIKKNNIKEIYEGKSLISLQIKNPKHDALESQRQLNQYIESFRQIITEISNMKNIEKLHLIYAGPASLAFYFGSILKLDTQDVKNTIVYHYTREFGYVWGLNLSTEQVIHLKEI